MSQTIRIQRALARCLGVTFPEFIRKRQRRDSRGLIVTADGAGVIRYRPIVLCDPFLPDNHRTIFKTETK